VDPDFSKARETVVDAGGRRVFVAATQVLLLISTSSSSSSLDAGCPDGGSRALGFDVSHCARLSLTFFGSVKVPLLRFVVERLLPRLKVRDEGLDERRCCVDDSVREMLHETWPKVMARCALLFGNSPRVRDWAVPQFLNVTVFLLRSCNKLCSMVSVRCFNDASMRCQFVR
jgi:hypothetical protein